MSGNGSLVIFHFQTKNLVLSGVRERIMHLKLLQGKFLSHTEVLLEALLVHMKGLTAAHQHFDGFHELCFRRSCICFASAIASQGQEVSMR